MNNEKNKEEKCAHVRTVYGEENGIFTTFCLDCMSNIKIIDYDVPPYLMGEQVHINRYKMYGSPRQVA